MEKRYLKKEEGEKSIHRKCQQHGDYGGNTEGVASIDNQRMQRQKNVL